MTGSDKRKKTEKKAIQGSRTVRTVNCDVPVQKGQEMELEITGLGSSGEGVGRFKDIAVFVPGA